MIPTKILRMDIQKAPSQKAYEMQTGSQSFNFDFIEANRQFDWVEISLVYEKSNKHTTIYDSYDAEKAA